MPSYTVREWDKIAHGEGEGEILLRHADKLASLAARSIFAGRGGSGVLEHGRNALRARGVVGILATSEVSLEILPAIEVAPAETVDRQNAEIRKRLVHMMAVALDLRIDLGKVTDIAWQRAARRSVVEGKRVAVRVDLGGRRIIDTQHKNT